MQTYLGSLNQRPIQIIIAVLFIFLLILPFGLNDYAQHIMVVTFYYVVLVQSWNLLAGYTGQFSLAHHTFASIGGYTSGLLIWHFDVPMWLGIMAAPVVSLILGLILGMIVLRMSAIYLAVATWAFAEVIRILVSANFRLTRGDAGLSMPPLFGTLDPFPYYYLFLGLMIFFLLLMYIVVNMPIGAFMRAIKDDDLAAQAMGINTVRWRLFVFSLTSVIAGTMGVFFGHYIALLSPVTMRFEEMAKVIIMAVIGGLGTFMGPIVGSSLVEYLFESAREYGQWRMVFFAVIVILLMRIDRNGVISLMQRGYRAITSRREGADARAR